MGVFHSYSRTRMTNELLKCSVPRAAKEFTYFRMYTSILTNPSAQCHNHSLNQYRRVVQLTSIETTCGLTSPPLFVTLVTLSSAFPYTFYAYILFSTGPSHCHKLLNTSSGPPKRDLFIQELTTEVPYSKSSDYIIPQFKNCCKHQKPPKSKPTFMSHILRRTEK